MDVHRKGIDGLQPHEAQVSRNEQDGREEGEMEHRSLSQLAAGRGRLWLCVALVVRLCCCVDDDFVKVHPLDVEMADRESEGVSDGSWETPAELSDDERVAEESSEYENTHKSSGDEVSSGYGLTCHPQSPSCLPLSASL